MSKRKTETKEEYEERKRRKKDKKKAKRAKKEDNANSSPSSVSSKNKTIDDENDVAISNTTPSVESYSSSSASSKDKTTAMQAMKPTISAVGNEENITDDDSPFKKKSISLTLGLLPVTLHNTEQGINDNLQEMILRYFHKLGGIVLAFDNVKTCKSSDGKAYGKIVNESPYIYYKVTCDLLLFEVKRGGKVVGAVTELSASHVGLLVLDSISVTIQLDSLRQNGFTYNTETDTWSKRDESGVDQTISIDSRLLFTVEELMEYDGFISLEGSGPLTLYHNAS